MDIDFNKIPKTFSLKDFGIEEDKDIWPPSEINKDFVIDFEIVSYNKKAIAKLIGKTDDSKDLSGLSKRKTWDALKAEIEYLERVSSLVRYNEKIPYLVSTMINAKWHLIRLVGLTKRIYGEDKISIELSPKMYDFISESFGGESFFKDYLAENNICLKILRYIC